MVVVDKVAVELEKEDVKVKEEAMPAETDVESRSR